MNQSLLHKEVIVAGVRIQYLERDAAAEPSSTPAKAPLLLLHGLLATAETFTTLIDHLPRDRRIIALDLLSFAPVDPTRPLDVHFAAYAEIIHAFIHIVGLNHAVAIGHSHGGALTLRLTASHPTLFSGIILMCPAHPFAGYRSHVVNFYLTRHGRALALSIPIAPRFMILRAYNEAAGPHSRITYAHLEPYMRVLRNRNTLRRVLKMLHHWEDDMTILRNELIASPIRLPAFLIWGDADPVVDISSAIELESNLPASERATLPRMGHLLSEEAPLECAALIASWLNR